MAKGQLGETIVRRKMEAKGWVCYAPFTPGAHAFDGLAVKDKSMCLAFDVKSKSRRNNYEDTGINVAHFEVYKRFSERHLMPFWLFFVDEIMGEIYGNTLKALSVPFRGRFDYPAQFGGVVYWPLARMHKMHTLTAEECAQLAALTQKKPPTQ